jgi:hypothetical protein
MVCCMIQSICTCIASTCSRVSEGGGGGLASWLLFSPLFLALLAAARFLVLAICSISIDKIKNTQKNGSRGKGIVVNP